MKLIQYGRRCSLWKKEDGGLCVQIYHLGVTYAYLEFMTATNARDAFNTLNATLVKIQSDPVNDGA